MGPSRGDETRIFHKDSTVLLKVGDNQKVKAYDVITSLENVYGKGSVFACVPKSGDCFEVTLPNKAVAEKLTAGVKIGDKSLECDLLYSDVMVVSFMHLPAYVTDHEIKGNLDKIGVEVKSDIKRRYYKGTTVADGTRYVETKFPPKVKSLNYLMKFETVYGPQMFKVKHNNQTKVCLQCYSDEHFIKNCPEFKCFRCGVQGHAKRECTAEKCRECYRYPTGCRCEEDRQNKASHADADADDDVYDQETDKDESLNDDDFDEEYGTEDEEAEDYFDDYLYKDCEEEYDDDHMDNTKQQEGDPKDDNSELLIDMSNTIEQTPNEEKDETEQMTTEQQTDTEQPIDIQHDKESEISEMEFEDQSDAWQQRKRKGGNKSNKDEKRVKDYLSVQQNGGGKKQKCDTDEPEKIKSS